MVNSMTGFAALKGQEAPYAWAWELRSVNAKGRDIRLRLPDWIEGLEPKVRAALSQAVARGNLSLGLRISRDEGAAPLAINEAQLARVLGALAHIENAAAEAELTLVHSTAADVLAQKGVLEAQAGEEDTAPLLAALLADLDPLIADFNAMRATEGAALAGVLDGQVATIEALVEEAAAAAEARRPKLAEALRDNLARVLDNTEGADEGRVAQELAMIAVKTDVTEELDRLDAHVAAARALLGSDGPIGRKLDFLMQEFMREANTLCSKSQSVELTRIGLDLKATIDQMREQVQNVE